MTTKLLTRQYGQLTCEERFSLLLGAMDRGDDAERDALGRSAPRVLYSERDFAKSMLAYQRLALLTYIDLLNAGLAFVNAWLLAESEPADAAQQEKAERCFCRALVSAYLVTTKLAAWRNFCAEMHFPPELFWKCQPGFERLQAIVEMTEILNVQEKDFVEIQTALNPDRADADASAQLTVASETRLNHQLFVDLARSGR